MTTALFLLRCTEIGLSMADLEELDMGMVIDMLIEKANDGHNYPRVATQEDMNNF